MIKNEDMSDYKLDVFEKDNTDGTWIRYFVNKDTREVVTTQLIIKSQEVK